MVNLKSKIESILFIYGDPVSFKKMAKILNVKESEVKDCIEELKKEYEKRGIAIFEKDGYAQMTTSPQNADIVKDLVESTLSEELTPAALETLSVVAYKEPISTQEINELRGVNSVLSLRTLLMKGLIEKNQSNDEKKTTFYKTTLDFLKKLGISKVSELPKYDELSKISGKTENL